MKDFGIERDKMAEQGFSRERESVVFTCKLHRQELLPVYCKDCQTSVCSTCVTKEHNNHNFIGIVEAAKNTGVDHKLEKEFESLQEHSKRLDQRTDEILEKCLSESESMIGNINARTDKIIEQINRQKSDLITKVKVMSEKCEHELLDGKDRRQRVLEMLRPSEECNRPTQEEFGVVKEAHLKLLVNEVLKTKVEHLPHNTGLPLSFSIQDYSSEDFREFAFGDISDDKNERASDYLEEETKTGKDSTCNSIPESTLQPDEDKSDQFFDCEDDGTVDVTPRGYKLENRKIKSIIPIDALNAYVLADSELCKLHFTSDGFTVMPVMQNVTQITGTRKGTVLVLQEISKNVSHILKDGKRVNFCTCQTFLPSVICASNKEFAIIEMHRTFERGNKRYLYNHTYIAEFNEMGVISRVLLDYKYRYFNRFFTSFLYHSVPDNIFYIEDRCLNICDINLKVTEKYTGSIGPKPSESFTPTSVCMDVDNQILVSVTDDNAIHLLDPQGKFLGPLMSERDGLIRPLSVTLDDYGYLWIGSENGDIIIARYRTLQDTMRFRYESTKQSALTDQNSEATPDSNGSNSGDDIVEKCNDRRNLSCQLC